MEIYDNGSKQIDLLDGRSRFDVVPVFNESDDFSVAGGDEAIIDFSLILDIACLDAATTAAKWRMSEYVRADVDLLGAARYFVDSELKHGELAERRARAELMLDRLEQAANIIRNGAGIFAGQQNPPGIHIEFGDNFDDWRMLGLHLIAAVENYAATNAGEVPEKMWPLLTTLLSNLNDGVKAKRAGSVTP